MHVRVQQRNGKKCLTTVQGLPKKFDLEKILKALKKGELVFGGFGRGPCTVHGRWFVESEQLGCGAWCDMHFGR